MYCVSFTRKENVKEELKWLRKKTYIPGTASAC